MIQNYIKIALRNLKKYKQFSFLNIFGLSMAITISLSLFLYVHDEMNYDTFHPNAGNKYRITMKTQMGEKDFHSAWTPAFIGVRLNNELPEIVESATLYKHFKGYSIKKEKEEFAIEDVYFSSPNFFEYFGFKLKYGAAESVLNDPGNIVLHEDLAAKLFPGEQVMGKMIETSEGLKKISGIMESSTHNNHFTPQIVGSLIGRWDIQDLASSTSFDASFYNYITLNTKSIESEKWNSLSASLMTEWTHADEGRKQDMGEQEFTMLLQRIRDIHLQSKLEFEMKANGNRTTVIVFSFVAMLLLFVASINYMNLASARYLERLKELGIRKVLGSNRYQLAVQYFTESLIVTTISAIIGVFIVQLALPLFNDLAGKSLVFSQLFQSEILLGLIVMIIICAGFSIIYPVIFISRAQPVNVFKFTSLNENKGNRFRRGTLIFQVAVSSVLLIFTFVSFQQLQFMQGAELGFEQDQVIILEINEREARSKIPLLKDELLKLSYVQSVGLTGQIPGDENLKTEPMGFESNEGKFQEVLTNYMFTGPDLASSLGLKIINGENFDERKGGANRGQEVIVNKSMVDAMNWNNPLGKKVKLPIGEARVVGVVEDFHLKSLHHKIEPLTIIYLDNWAEALVIKANTQNIAQALKEIEQTQKRVISNTTFNYSFLDERFAIQYEADQQKAQLFMIFSVLTITIASLGLVGLIGFSIIRRQKEMSVRRIFGADATKIIILFFREYGNVILIGVILSVPLANYLVKDWLMNFPYQIQLSFYQFALPILLLIVVTGGIIVFRISKVSRSNPAEILRKD